MKLGFLGPKGNFSFEVAKNYSKTSELKEYNTISEVIVGLGNVDLDINKNIEWLKKECNYLKILGKYENES